MAGVRNHEKLNVWKLSEEVATRVRRILNEPGVRSDFDLKDQLSRSAERIGPDIAEGFSRFKPRDNARFVRLAKASLTEVIVHLEKAVAKGYVTSDEIAVTCRFARRARGAAIRYIQYLETAKEPHTTVPEENTESTSPDLPDDGDPARS